MNPKNYVYDWQNAEDQKKIAEAFEDLGTTFNDLLKWKDYENYIFTKVHGEKLPQITISRKIKQITDILYKQQTIENPIKLSLDFLSPKYKRTKSSISKYFPEGFSQGVTSEIAGTTGSGKTFFLFMLLFYNCLTLFSNKNNKAKIIYYDFLSEFNYEFMREYFKSNSYINRIEIRQENITLTKFNYELSVIMNQVEKENIKYLFIDNLDFLFIDVENERDITLLEENFYRLTKLGIGIIYTCKLKKLYENKVQSFINLDTEISEKIDLVSMESNIKSKYFKQTKRNKIMLYTHSGLKTRRRVLLMFENGIHEKKSYMLNIDEFDYISFKKHFPQTQHSFDVDK